MPDSSVGQLGASDLQRVARRAKGASAGISAMANAMREASLRLRSLRARIELGEDAPPPSWEVERHEFVDREADRA